MPEHDPQHYPHIHTSTDNGSRPPTTQQANWQPPLPSLQSTHVQAQEARDEVARFDTVLAKILRQKEIAVEHTARQATTTKQHEEAAKKAKAAEAESLRLSIAASLRLFLLVMSPCDQPVGVTSQLKSVQ